MKLSSSLRRRLGPLVMALGCLVIAAARADDDDRRATWLPTGQMITPEATPGATLRQLDPHIKDFPALRADHAISLALSPDGGTMLALTSGFNRLPDLSGKPIPVASNEYVFVYDVSGGSAVERQVVQLPNSFVGIAWAPDGSAFYAGGGVDDAVHLFRRGDEGWAEAGQPITLNHGGHGVGLRGTQAVTAGLAVTGDGATLVVADFENDAVSMVDLKTRTVRDLDLRPGKSDPASHGQPGGSYPFWVTIKNPDIAYVSSLRDREIVVVRLGTTPAVLRRITVPGNPNRMVLNRDQSRLYVTADNSDSVSIMDTATDRVVNTIRTAAPASLMADEKPYRGASPNALALSPDETRLYVTNGGANSLAVVALDRKDPAVIGLVPTGWAPSAVALARGMLYVLNGKSVPGPNPRMCHFEWRDPAAANRCIGADDYIEELEKAGLQSLPVPRENDLDELTRQVTANDRYSVSEDPADAGLMAELRRRIRHVIYIVKENRTYDQVLGDLGKGNGDPSLTEFGRAITPNQHALAKGFVNLDGFYTSGEVSGDGWPWSTAARESDIGAMQIPLQYARRGQSYDVEGTNRNINVALPDLAARRKADPDTPDDEDILPGTADVAAVDPAAGPPERGYLWDAALRAGLDVRNYGFFCDLVRYSPKASAPIPVERMPADTGTVVAYPAKPALIPVTDPYFRSFDNKLPDFYREREWEREFDGYVSSGKLPALSLVRLMHDHMGEFDGAIDGVDTPETQVADNDYAVGLLIEKLAHSPYRDSTLVFVIEDDAQDGPDHIDAHRSIAFVAGPYVKQGAIVSRRYTTVNALRTIEDVLGLEHLSLNDAHQRPMTDIFDLQQKDWDFRALVPAVLRGTKLPLPSGSGRAQPAVLVHPAAWWGERTRSMDFSAEDRVDTAAFNRLLWDGLMGGRPYPSARSRADLSGSPAR